MLQKIKNVGISAAHQAAAILAAASITARVNAASWGPSIASITGSGVPSAGKGSGAAPVVVTIVDKTSGLIQVVQSAVQTANRNGNSLTYAGSI